MSKPETIIDREHLTITIKGKIGRQNVVYIFYASNKEIFEEELKRLGKNEMS